MIDIDNIKKELSGSKFFSDIFYFDEIDSTNSFAKDLENDSLVIAEYQAKGKGRFDHVWESDKGANLTFSIRKKIEIPADKIAFINFFFIGSIFGILKAEIDKNNNSSLLAIKWPNDIIYDGKKISGVLTESNITKNIFTIGIGINVNQEKFNPQFQAVSLYNVTGVLADRTKLLYSLISSFEKNFDKLLNTSNDLLEIWKKNSNLINKEVAFILPDSAEKIAKVLNLQEDGSIKLLIEGQEQAYYSGEIKITRIGN